MRQGRLLAAANQAQKEPLERLLGVVRLALVRCLCCRRAPSSPAAARCSVNHATRAETGATLLRLAGSGHRHCPGLPGDERHAGHHPGPALCHQPGADDRRVAAAWSGIPSEGHPAAWPCLNACAPPGIHGAAGYHTAPPGSRVRVYVQELCSFDAQEGPKSHVGQQVGMMDCLDVTAACAALA